jgi:hypothetical protein
MWSVRITPQIRPVSRRRIRCHTTPPGDFLAADRKHRSDAARIGAVGIKTQKLFVACHGVERDRRGIGIVLIAEVAHRPVTDIGERHRIRWRRCVGRALGHEEWVGNLRCVPRYFGALGLLADTEPHAREDVVETQSAVADHFGERGRVSTVGTLFVRTDRARRGVEGNRHVRRRVGQCQSACKRLAAARERILPRCIQDHDLDTPGHRRERLQKIRHSDRLQRHIDIARDVGVDRDEIILAFKLQSIAREINQRDGVRSCR